MLKILQLFICSIVFIGCNIESNNKINKKIDNNISNEEKVDKNKTIPIDYKKRFNHYLNYIEKRTKKRLKKDYNGYIDSYALYDMQTFLQTSLILADEYGDKEMLKNFLNLVNIPLNKDYLSKNNLWVDRNYYPGKEVRLVVSQYFALLTRTLSACSRHNINTDIILKSKYKLKIIKDHINKWIKEPFYYNVANDKDIFLVMSVISFSDYLRINNIDNTDYEHWNEYIENYFYDNMLYLMNDMPCKKNQNKACIVFAKDGWINYKEEHPYFIDNDYSAYGEEIIDESSDIIPNAMFDSSGNIKQEKPEKLATGATDLSHGRRFNWLFETINRLGFINYNIKIPDKFLIGWANNLAYNVCVDNKKEIFFTNYTDGVNGWYRVGYNNRKSFGYPPKSLSLSFVGSSYGMFGSYNDKIYTCIDKWTKLHSFLVEESYNYRYYIEYTASKLINLKKELKKDK